MVAIAGGADIRCAKYATYGTQELSDSVILALRDRTACLVENHGMIAIGSTTSTAVATAIEVEALAQQYLLSMVVGGPELLSIEQMTAVLSKFAEYKQLKGTT
jgi:L-fuculose-phosphate aldolase